MTRDEWEGMLDATPHDWDLRLIYADWLEEQGEVVPAAGQRWQATNKKCPRPGYQWTSKKTGDHPHWVWAGPDGRSWFYYKDPADWSKGWSRPEKGTEEEVAETVLARTRCADDRKDMRPGLEYPTVAVFWTRRRAEEALAAALAAAPTKEGAR